MQRLLLLLSILFLYFNTKAQNNISVTGIVADSASKMPVEYATITLSDAKTNKTVNGTTTDSLGYFNLTGVESGVYNFSFEFIGYFKKTINNIKIEQSRTPHNIGMIFLHKDLNTLKDVVVTSQAKLVENKIDKLVYNAENDLTSVGGLATDVLKKVPQVSVDADGNVELAGSSNVRFLIDGKPSTAFGSNIADVLQAIPASQIKSVEVITNPGAKYDAQGLGGIINIILKKSKVNGVNGNVSLSLGTRLENGSFNITMRHGNFGLHAFTSGNERLPAQTPTSSYRTTTDTINKEYDILMQQSTPETKRYGTESGLGFDWTLKKYNSFSGSLNYSKYGYSGNGIMSQQQQVIPFNSNDVISDIQSLSNSANKYYSDYINADLDYKRTFAKEDQSLEIDVSTNYGHDNSAGGNFQTLIPQDSVFYGINNKNIGRQNETEIEIDYTQPFAKDIVFDAGADLTFDKINSNAQVYALQTDSKEYIYDSLISNHLTYNQQVYALYAELSMPVGHLFDVKIGSRYERTEISSFYSNAAQQAKTPGYNTVVPSAFLLHHLTDHQTLKLSYSKRIERPDYEDLNPFINTADPKNITAGNPYLKPEIGNRVEFSYNHEYGNAGSFMITAFYRANKDDIQPYTAVYPELAIGDSVYTNVSVSTRENIGREHNMGVNLFGDVRATDKFSLRTNLSFFKRHIINDIDSGSDAHSFNYRINLNATYQFSKSLSAEFFGNFNSPRNELQGKYPSFTFYTFAARKQLWNKKASIALTASNFLSEYLKLPTELFGTNFTSTNVRKIPIRSFGINFTYKFGKLEFKKDKDDSKDNSVPELGSGNN
ncbi:MAG: TonB-dependent receptor [Parafilimonas sp.]|nr:TonB-dependent receptor [Parafilimonas sp.]